MEYFIQQKQKSNFILLFGPYSSPELCTGVYLVWTSSTVLVVGETFSSQRGRMYTFPHFQKKRRKKT